ncbi:MAG: AbrB/MazE/SpoVT family DNA-binding domain-containing protein [Thermoplasmatota archaeon]
MAQIEAEVKKWGNTLGIRIPSGIARAEGIVPGITVHVRIEKLTRPEPGFFGMGRDHPGWKKFSYARYKARLLREERRRDIVG